MAKSVLFLDQLDSFSYNIVHLLESILGDAHSVAVIRYDDEQAWSDLELNGIIGCSGLVIGPGSYTGLRIGSSLAKGLCFTLNVPLLAIPGMYGLGQWLLENNKQLKVLS